MRRGEYSEILVLAGERHLVTRIVLSPLEYWISTTHPADVAELRRGEAQHGDLWDAIRACAEVFPRAWSRRKCRRLRNARIAL